MAAVESAACDLRGGVRLRRSPARRPWKSSTARWPRRTLSLDELATIDPATLDASDAVSYELFRMELSDRLESHRSGEEQLTLNADSGFHFELGQLADQVPAATAQEIDNYPSRLEQFPRVFDEQIAQMRRGLACGMTPARGGARRRRPDGGGLGGRRTREERLLAPLAAMLRESIPGRERERLVDAARGG
ncbi:MAG: DUF885 family protein [Thermoanaerobaculia bacterium]